MSLVFKCSSATSSLLPKKVKFTQKFLQIPLTESSEAYSEALRADLKLFETKLQNDFPSDNEEQNHADSILTGIKNGVLLSESEWALVAQNREGNPISIY